ncbi:hypothetical protein [Microbacterium aureliae]
MLVKSEVGRGLRGRRDVTATAILLTIAILLLLVLGWLGPPMMILGIIAVCGGLLILVFRASPSLAATVWLLTLVLLPPWIYLQVLGYRVVPLAVISVAIILAWSGKSMARFTSVDLAVILLLAAVAAGVAWGGTPGYLASQAVLEWGAAYWAGRHLMTMPSFSRNLIRVAALLGGLAMLQLLLSFNIAEMWPYTYAVGAENWMGLQVRGGLTRAEVTLGHSIALGGVLCLALPFALMGMRGHQRLAVSGLIIGGAIATLSRASWLSVAVALVLVVTLNPRLRPAQRVVTAGVSLIGLVIAAGPLGDLLSEGGAEVANSAAYRGNLLELLPDLNVVGLASGAVAVDGGPTYAWRNFYSIDNGLLFVGLYCGALAAILYLLVYLLIGRGVLVASATPASLAIVAHIPFLLTVAPITQYQSVYWAVVGAAVTSLWPRASQQLTTPATERARTSEPAPSMP